MLELQQHGIQSALIHGKQVSADLLDAPRDSIAVQRPQDIESLEDHKRQRSLEDVRLLFHNKARFIAPPFWFPTGNVTQVLWENNR